MINLTAKTNINHLSCCPTVATDPDKKWGTEQQRMWNDVNQTLNEQWICRMHTIKSEFNKNVFVPALSNRVLYFIFCQKYFLEHFMNMLSNHLVTQEITDPSTLKTLKYMTHHYY